MPVPMIVATRSASSGGPSAQPASLIASSRGEYRELREAVVAALLLPRQQVTRLEVRAARKAVLDRGLAGGPALVQRAGAHAKRSNGADAGYDDATVS